MIRLPQEYNYTELYLTFKCSFGCSYCINNRKFLKARKELTWTTWVEALNRIDFKEVSLTLGGGEPTLYPDFYPLIANLNPKIKLDLLTNLSFDVNYFIQHIKPTRFTPASKPFYHSIRASFHVDNSKKATLIEKAKLLIDNGFNVGIFGIAHPHYINENMEMAWLCNTNSVPFYTKDFLGKIGNKMYGYYKYPIGLQGRRKRKVLCKTRELLIDPSGDIYRCHRDLYLAENPINNITAKDLSIESKFRSCKNYGECNPCDVKAKTNKFLNGVECQVEIIEP